MATPAHRDLEQAVLRGSELLKQGKLDDAQKAFRAALILDGNNTKVLALLGLTHFRAGQFEQARPLYEDLVERAPTDASHRLNLGLVYLKLGDSERAINALEASRALDPSQGRAVSYLGLAYARAGRYAEAYRAFLLAGQHDLAKEIEANLTTAERDGIHQQLQRAGIEPAIPRTMTPLQKPRTGLTPPAGLPTVAPPTVAPPTTPQATPQQQPAPAVAERPRTLTPQHPPLIERPPAEKPKSRSVTGEIAIVSKPGSPITKLPIEREYDLAPEPVAKATPPSPPAKARVETLSLPKPEADTQPMAKMPEAPPDPKADTQPLPKTDGDAQPARRHVSGVFEIRAPKPEPRGPRPVESSPEIRIEPERPTPVPGAPPHEMTSPRVTDSLQFVLPARDPVPQPLEGQSMISRAVAVASPSSAAAATAGSRVSLGGTPPIPLSQLATDELVRPDDGDHPFEVSASGALVIRVRERVLTRLDGIHVTGGDLAYERAMRRSRGHQTEDKFDYGGTQLFTVTGTGYLLALPGSRTFTAVSLDDDIFYLREDLVFAFEASLRWENGNVPGLRGRLPVVQFRGDGAVAVRSDKPLVRVKLPAQGVVFVDATRLAGWIGRVIPRAVVPPSGGPMGDVCVECTGEGVVLVDPVGDPAGLAKPEPRTKPTSIPPPPPARSEPAPQASAELSLDEFRDEF